MGAGRAHHTSTLLATGEVLITGGLYYKDNSYLDSAALYNPGTNNWAPVGAMHQPRAFHQAVRMDSQTGAGKLLISGGENSSQTLSSVEIYDPDNQMFEYDPQQEMKTARSHHCAVTLESGEVVVIGGKQSDGSVDGTGEVYQYPDGFKEQTFNLTQARMDHRCVSLAGGEVLITGGRNAEAPPRPVLKPIGSVAAGISSEDVVAYPGTVDRDAAGVGDAAADIDLTARRRPAPEFFQERFPQLEYLVVAEVARRYVTQVLNAAGQERLQPLFDVFAPPFLFY